ncbi:MAG: response regulator [Planctomycetes bacterium]|nr:response regulator [Planctomycetota bacterium]
MAIEGDDAREAPPDAEEPHAASDEAEDDTSFPIVGVGASAGGLEAFTQFLKALPVDTGMAFVLVQHLSPSHPSALAEILSRATRMTVTEVLGASRVEPNHVYVIPPDHSIVFEQGLLQLLPRETKGIHKPVDQLFRSLAENRRHRAIGVVLSGTATDGTLGLEAIKAEGGITFAQDETAQHEGMPISAVASGCVDFVLAPDAIAQELVRISRHPHVAPSASLQEEDSQSQLAEVVKLLHRATGVDFSHYKQSTLYRRVTRRVLFRKLDGLEAYLQHLRQTPGEAEALFQDLLIGVTSFFRDPEAFESLKRSVFPRLLKDRPSSDPVRIWTLGCSTGQEAFSLAMAFAEVAEDAGSQATLQVFATDINAEAIHRARAGVYPREIESEVTPAQLRRFFVKMDGGYRINKSIRDRCIFSRHNVLTDPPFSRIDLISCRNLLIYMDSVLQQRVMPLLHYALKPKGFLWLGTSETIGAHRDLFAVEDQNQKIFVKKPGAFWPARPFPLQRESLTRGAFVPMHAKPLEPADLPREADRLLSHRFSPPGVVVSADLDILQYRGDTGPYLAPAPGKASLNLLKMLREGLLVAVRSIVARAAKSGTPEREEGVRVKTAEGFRVVAVEVIPLDANAATERAGFLVLFDAAPSLSQDPSARQESAPFASDAGDAHLVQELAVTREYLQSVIEQQETANAELQSANEEVQSANEELQSTNEELETSKEEIQSSNEELATVNDELNHRNAELHRINDDMVNVLDRVQVAVVMVGPDLRVRRFTPLAEKLLHVIPTDVGRPLADIKLNFSDAPDIEVLLRKAMDTATTVEHEVRDKRGRWYSLRIYPYRTSESAIDGALLMLVDIDLSKRAHQITDNIVATVRSPLLVLDADILVRAANRSFYRMFQTTPEATLGRSLFELGGGHWNVLHLRQNLEAILASGESFSDFQIDQEWQRIGKRTMVLNGQRLLQGDTPTASILLAIEDFTEQKRVEAELRLSEMRFRRLFEAAKDGILILDAVTEKVTQVNPFLTNLLDFPAEHFVGKQLWEIGVLRDSEANQTAVKLLRERGTLRCEELQIAGRDGTLHPVEMIANAYFEGDQAVIQCNLRDIAERRRLEQRLREQAAELSALYHRKDEFLAMLSHELRSPLAPISNALRILELEKRSENRIQQQARVIIERQMAQLQHLVDDLLEVSRITTGRLQLRRESVEVSEIVARAVETVRPILDQHQHELLLAQPAEPVWLYADFSRLEQVLVNLLTNAAKFTDKRGHIWLTVEKVGEECLMRVRDTGVGISPELLPRVFDLFAQGERSLDRSHGGLGIGLALVKRLTELHGGTVLVSSALGHGTEFVVRLPIAHPSASSDATATAPELEAQPTRRKLRVLVVDDSFDTASSLATLLTLSGHAVSSAYDGLAAIQAAREQRPDVVLLDIGLPGLDGYEVARRLRADPDLAHVVLIAMTGYGQEVDRQAALSAGFHQHMVKPVAFSKLEAALAAIEPRA